MNEVGWCPFYSLWQCYQKGNRDFNHFLHYIQELDRQVPLIDEIDTKVRTFYIQPLAISIGSEGETMLKKSI